VPRREKPCVALERTQPLLPLSFGYDEGVTHDYLRHGNTTLFAALDLLDGTVLAQCRLRLAARPHHSATDHG
jgi:hypothetical protein